MYGLIGPPPPRPGPERKPQEPSSRDQRGPTRPAAPKEWNLHLESAGTDIPAGFLAGSPSTAVLAVEDVCWEAAVEDWKHRRAAAVAGPGPDGLGSRGPVARGEGRPPAAPGGRSPARTVSPRRGRRGGEADRPLRAMTGQVAHRPSAIGPEVPAGPGPPALGPRPRPGAMLEATPEEWGDPSCNPPSSSATTGPPRAGPPRPKPPARPRCAVPG